MNEEFIYQPDSQSLIACMTMSVVIRLDLLVSPISMLALQYLFISLGVLSAALSIASIAASSKTVWLSIIITGVLRFSMASLVIFKK